MKPFFSVKFIETEVGMEMEIEDGLTMTKVTIKDEGPKGDVFDDSFNMFNIGAWIVKILKPKYQKIINGEIK